MERSDGQGRTPTERRVVSLAVALILFVAGLQILLRFEGPRRFLNRSIRLEGEALSQSVEGLEQDAYPWLEWPPPDASEAPSNWATIYLRFLGVLPARAWVLVNGRVAKQLGPEGGSVTVRDGDNGVYSPDRGSAWSYRLQRRTSSRHRHLGCRPGHAGDWDIGLR